MLHAWLRNLPGDSPPGRKLIMHQEISYVGTLLNPVLHWGLQSARDSPPQGLANHAASLSEGSSPRRTSQMPAYGQHCAQFLVRQSLAANSNAKRWAPLVYILFRAAWPSLAQCLSAHTVARLPNSCILAKSLDDSSPARPGWLEIHGHSSHSGLDPVQIRSGGGGWRGPGKTKG